MKVIIIEDGNHKLLGTAKDYSSAIDALVAEGLLNGSTLVFPLDGNLETDPTVPIEQLYGENWVKEVKKFNKEERMTFFDYLFYFYEDEVFGA